jgi:hypothetical protein
MVGRLILAGVWWVLPAAVQAQAPEGCFDVRVGLWEPLSESQLIPDGYTAPPSERNDSLLFVLPSRVRLVETEAEWPNPGNQVEVPAGALDSPHSRRSWLLEGDTLVLVFSNGFAGVSGRLIQGPDGWSGRIRSSTDQVGFLRWGRTVELLRSSCAVDILPGVDPTELPRTVGFEGAFRLELGRPLPTSSGIEGGGPSGVTLTWPPTGQFSGAHQAEVALTRDGRIRAIELRYPPDFDMGAFLVALQASFGAGTELSPLDGVSWTSRTTTLLAVVSHNGQVPHRVVLGDPRLGVR